MERLYQMKVVPDLLSEMHPSVDVRITADTLGRVPNKAYQGVEPGTFLLPRQVSITDSGFTFLNHLEPLFNRPSTHPRFTPMYFTQTLVFILWFSLMQVIHESVKSSLCGDSFPCQMFPTKQMPHIPHIYIGCST